MTALLRRAALFAMLLVALDPSALRAQAEREPVLPVPYGVGERMEYSVYFGKLKAGNGSMEVKDIQDIRGRDTWHAVWELHGGIRFVYHIDDVFETWIDRRTGNSLRFHRDQNEGRRDKESTFDMYPERSMFSENTDSIEAGVRNPLDDASFVYFVRTIPLVVGETHSFNRYFRPDRNPVTLKILRKDTIEVAGRRWPAIVVQPTFKSGGPFGENGHAEVWFSDDRNRIMLQMKSSLPFGSINLYLTSYRPAPAASAAP